MKKSAADILREINEFQPKTDECMDSSLDKTIQKFDEVYRIYTIGFVNAVLRADGLLKNIPDAMEILTEDDMKAFCEFLKPFLLSSAELLIAAFDDEDNGDKTQLEVKKQASLRVVKEGENKGLQFLLELIEKRKKDE